MSEDLSLHSFFVSIGNNKNIIASSLLIIIILLSVSFTKSIT